MFKNIRFPNRAAVAVADRAAALNRGRKAGPGAFGGDQNGTVAMMFGLTLAGLMMFTGAAVDFGRWLDARSQTRSAVDAAVLAGARALQVNPTDTAGALKSARAFYAANVKSRTAVKKDTIDFAVGANGKSIKATGTAFIDTPILSVAHIKRLPVLSLSGADSSAATFDLGGSSQQDLEISMMLDTTGSMAGQKIADLKTAANDLINIVLAGNGNGKEVRVALAPFAEAVRPGAALLSKVRGTYASTYSFKDRSGRKQTYALSNCVSERDGAAAYTDVAPAGADMLGAVYTKTGSCTTTSDIVPLTLDQSKLTAAVNGLVASGGTAGHIGSAWAWYLLSPNWGSVLPSASKPASYGDTSVKKIAILMTDGEYNTEYDSHGLMTSTSGAGAAVNGPSDTQARTVCSKMKQAGVEVYTVGFDMTLQSAIDTLRDCATDPGKAYVAQDGAQLKAVFRDIAIRLSPLHLTN